MKELLKSAFERLDKDAWERVCLAAVRSQSFDEWFSDVDEYPLSKETELTNGGFTIKVEQCKKYADCDIEIAITSEGVVRAQHWNGEEENGVGINWVNVEDQLRKELGV